MRDLDSSEFRFAVSADSAIGNPQLENPIAFCANATVPANWASIRPLNYVNTIPIPQMFQGRNFVGSCYVLPTSAVIDSPGSKNDFRGYFRLEAAASTNPGTEQVRIGFIDKTYYIDDNNKFKLITSTIPEGKHSVRIEFTNTPIINIANALSLLTIFALIVFYIKKWPKIIY